jgi:predicted NBD/HSP70 family sugar kinase
VQDAASMVSTAIGVSSARSSSRTVVMDLGGTVIRVARFDPETGGHGRVWRAPTPNYLAYPTLSADRIIDMLGASVEREITAALQDESPDSILVGYPGPVTRSGVAIRSPTVLGPQSVHAVDVASMLAQRWPGAAVRVLNDLTCAGYAFVRSGHRNFCVLTVGSGIGNKIFLDGRPWTGDRGFGGEIGHVQVAPMSGTPVADLRDDLGNISSGRGTVWLARLWARRCPGDFRGSGLAALSAEASDQMWSEQLVRSFHRSDVLARAIVAAGAQPLAAALAHVHLAIGLERFFITGGFASALGEEYRRMLVQMLRECAWDVGQDWDSMVLVSEAQCEDGLLGACYLASIDAGREGS